MIRSPCEITPQNPYFVYSWVSGPRLLDVPSHTQPVPAVPELPFMSLNNLVHFQVHVRGADADLLSLEGTCTVAGEFNFSPVGLNCGFVQKLPWPKEVFSLHTAYPPHP